MSRSLAWSYRPVRLLPNQSVCRASDYDGNLDGYFTLVTDEADGSGQIGPVAGFAWHASRATHRKW